MQNGILHSERQHFGMQQDTAVCEMLSCLYLLIAHKTVCTFASSPEIYKCLIFVLRLIEVALFRHDTCCPVTSDKKILIRIISLFLHHRALITLLCIIILHFVFRQETVVRPYTINVHIAVKASRTLHYVMYGDIFTRAVVLYVVAIPYIKSTVGILVVHVIGARLGGKRVHVIVRAVPAYEVYAHRGVRNVQYLIFMIFVSCLKNKLPAVLPAQTFRHDILWLWIYPGIVPPEVLHHHCLYLRGGVCHAYALIVCLHRDLLM